MPLPLEFVLARRYLAPRRRAGAVTVMTWVSTAGVVIGVAALVIVLAVVSGFQRELETRIVGTNAHVIVLPPEGRSDLSDGERVAEAVRRAPGIVAATPFVFGKAMIASTTNIDGVAIKGVDPAHERLVTTVLSTVSPPLREDVISGVILGRQLARALHVDAGDEITLTAAAVPGMLGAFAQPRVITLKVQGVFTTGLYEFDSSLGLVSISTGQALFGLEGGVSGVAASVPDLMRAQLDADRLQASMGPAVHVMSWMEQNANLFAWMRMEKLVMFLILTLIVVVAAFHITSSLSMTVVEKRGDIGILRSMGATAGLVQRVFVTMGAVIGFTGTTLGLALGLAAASALSYWHVIDLPGDVYFLDTLPVRIQAGDVTIVALASCTLCLLATVAPARRAAALHPVEAIRVGE